MGDRVRPSPAPEATAGKFLIPFAPKSGFWKACAGLLQSRRWGKCRFPKRAEARCRLKPTLQLHGAGDILYGAWTVRIDSLEDRKLGGEKLCRHDVGDRRVEIARAFTEGTLQRKLDQPRRFRAGFGIPFI